MSVKMLTIYSIVCKDPTITDIYIGSTKDYERRQISHKSVCNDHNNRNFNIKLYQFIRVNGGFDNFMFKVLNEIEYIDNSWKRRQEQCYIDLMKPTLNSQRAYEKNKEGYAQRMKNYYELNKQVITEQQKKYVEENKEAISQQHKEYRELNKEAIAQQGKDYRELNKEAISQRRRERRQAKKLQDRNLDVLNQGT